MGVQMFNDIFADLIEPGEVELAAIWFIGNPVTLPSGRKAVRVTIGDEITVQDGTLVNSTTGIATHRVIGCFGTINSSRLCFNTINISTNEPEVIHIK